MAENILQIPYDVGEQLKVASRLLSGQSAMLDRELVVWSDIDPDPENGHFGKVCLDHRHVERMARNLAEIAQFLGALAEYGDHGQPVQAVEEA